jgi:hypothetical protein
MERSFDLPALTLQLHALDFGHASKANLLRSTHFSLGTRALETRKLGLALGLGCK